MKLELREASIGYDRRNPAQSYINLELNSGEICSILGPNGCGKTTLFKSMLGLVPFIRGGAFIDGDDISKWTLSRLASSIAYVNQAHNPPFPYQVKDMVLLGRVNSLGYASKPTDNDYYIVENAMIDMGIYDLRNEIYTDISGGELQLVMIARALAQQPQLLVLDEPTAALDYGNVVRVIRKIRSLAERGYAVLMTTHNPDHAFMCRSNVLLLQHDYPPKFGSAIDIVTERNMKQAYGLNIKIVEFVNTENEIMRMCSPVF